MTRRLRAPAAALLATALVALASCERTSGPPPSVLLIVIDTLRADHVGAYGYERPTTPNLDALAARGTRFASARASSSWTLPSVASIMTGLYPAVHGADHSDAALSADAATMAAAFRDAGYETAAFSANPAFVAAPQGIANGFDQFRVLHGAPAEPRALGAIPGDASMKNWVMQASAEEVTSAAGQWLARRQKKLETRPFFLYLHYFDPHAAYTPPARFALRFGVAEDDPLRGDAQWPFLLADQAPAPDVLATLVKLYDAEIAATDAALGTLFEGPARELGDSTIVVVTADHGEEFGDHGGVQHGRTLFDELLHVPLILAGPGLPRGSVVATTVSLTGLWSTISDLAGTGAPPTGNHSQVEPSFRPAIDGHEAGHAIFADLEARYAKDHQQHRRALIDGNWKLLLDPERGSQLFDLASDAGEHRERGEADRERQSSMRSRILERDAVAATRRSIAPPKQIILDPARREQLKSLGYLQ